MLLAELAVSESRDVCPVAKVRLSTGARWGESEGLKVRQVRDNQIRFGDTKSGKVRTVPITAALQGELHAHHDANATGERLFAACYGEFRKGIERTAIDLPDGQLSHVLRHGFASHFMQRGGNILTLQKTLGHATLAMTMRYAHMAP